MVKFLGISPVYSPPRRTYSAGCDPSEAPKVTIMDLLYIVAAAAAAALALEPMLRARQRGAATRSFSVALPDGGEIVMTVRAAAPISAGECRLVDVAAREMAMLLQRRGAADPFGLEVNALGPLIVRRNGEEIVAWGGPKAGRRQALAIFAFLLDRKDRGVHRDEVVELVWPEAELKQADIAFHRTIGGLRRVLAAPEPDALRRVITAREGVYRLDPALVRWSDVDEFEDHLSVIESDNDVADMEAHLAVARRLYRADYLDDCPHYGDSSHVEVRRQMLRDRYVGALRTVAEARERAGSLAAAAQLFREAAALSGSPIAGDMPRPHLVQPAA